MKARPSTRRQWTLRSRLAAGFASLIVLSSILSIAALGAVNKIGNDVRVIIDDSLPGVVEADRMLLKGYDYRATFLRYLVTQDPAARAELQTAALRLGDELREALARYEATIVIEEDRRIFEQVGPAFEKLQTTALELKRLIDEGRETEAFAFLDQEVAGEYQAFRQRAEALTDYNRDLGEDRAATIGTGIA